MLSSSPSRSFRLEAMYVETLSFNTSEDSQSSLVHAEADRLPIGLDTSSSPVGLPSSASFSSLHSTSSTSDYFDRRSFLYESILSIDDFFIEQRSEEFSSGVGQSIQTLRNLLFDVLGMTPKRERCSSCILSRFTCRCDTAPCKRRPWF